MVCRLHHNTLYMNIIILYQSLFMHCLYLPVMVGKLLVVVTRGLFLKTPETFGTCYNFLPSQKTKAFSGSMEFYSKSSLSYLKIIVKGQAIRISRSHFLKWLIGPKQFTHFQEVGPSIYNLLKKQDCDCSKQLKIERIWKRMITKGKRLQMIY